MTAEDRWEYKKTSIDNLNLHKIKQKKNREIPKEENHTDIQKSKN